MKISAKVLLVLLVIAGLSCNELMEQSELFEMVFVEGGTYTAKKTSHQIESFYIGKYEITQKLWVKIMGNNPSEFKNCDNCPVETVSWNDVQDFLKKLNANYPGKNYRLPNEIEWEFAALGGNNSKGFTYAGGNNPDQIGWYRGNSDDKTHRVGQKKPNELGIYDMSGNIWEWCQDPYDSQKAEESPVISTRVFRGGGWFFQEQTLNVLHRAEAAPYFRSFNIGFRLARTP